MDSVFNTGEPDSEVFERGVPGTLDRISNELDLLTKNVDVLNDRLAVVSVERELPTEQAARDASSETSTIGDILINDLNRIMTLSNRINAMIYRLDI